MKLTTSIEFSREDVENAMIDKFLDIAGPVPVGYKVIAEPTWYSINPVTISIAKIEEKQTEQTEIASAVTAG